LNYFKIEKYFRQYCTENQQTFYVQQLLSQIRDNYDIMWENMVDDNMGHARASQYN